MALPLEPGLVVEFVSEHMVLGFPTTWSGLVHTSNVRGPVTHKDQNRICCTFPLLPLHNTVSFGGGAGYVGCYGFQYKSLWISLMSELRLT